MSISMYYKVIYKLKKSNNLIVWEEEFITLEVIKAIVNQLKNGFTSINWVIIEWFNSLELFKIIEKDYIYKKDWKHFTKIETSADLNPYMSYEDIYSLSNNKDNYIPKENDITNKIFLECEVWYNLIINFKNDKLYINDKEVYCPNKWSDRFIFLKLIFSKPKWIYISMLDILNELEGIDFDLNTKEAKRIYNIINKINNIIEEKVKIKKFFSFWKWDNKGKVCRNY